MTQPRRDHNATSYSTETKREQYRQEKFQRAEIITLRAIALKRRQSTACGHPCDCRDHNATSYSTETFGRRGLSARLLRRDHNATSYNAEHTDSENITIQDIAAISPQMRGITLVLSAHSIETAASNVYAKHPTIDASC